MQGAWRCKHALSELRHLKSEAREAGKLLEDKKVLEVKVGVVESQPGPAERLCCLLVGLACP
jgi:hypothetical protein